MINKLTISCILFLSLALPAHTLNLEHKIVFPNASEIIKKTGSDSALLKLTVEADTLFAQRKYDSAAILYKNLAKQYALNGNPLECISSWRQTATAFAAMAIFDSANLYINKAIGKAKSIQDKTNTKNDALQKCYSLAGKIYAKEGKFGKSLEYHSANVVLIEEIKGKENREYTSALDEYASIYIKTGKVDSAMILWTRSLSIKNKILKNNDPEIGKTYYLMASQFFFKSKYDSALCYLKKALDHTPKTDLALLARINGNIGLIYQTTLNTKQSLEYFEKALAMNTSMYGTNNLEVSKSYTSLGASHVELGNHEKALDYFNKAMEIEQRICGPENYACYSHSLYNYLHSFYFDNGDIQKALEYAEVALKISLKKYTASSPYLFYDYYILGKLMSEVNLNDSALYYYHKALSFSNTTDDYIYDIYHRLSKIHSLKGNMAKAYDCLEHAITLAKKKYGETNYHVTYLYFTYADFLIKEHKPEKAHYFIALADSVRKQCYGSLQKSRHNINIAYGDIQYLLGNYDSAKKYYLQAITDIKTESANLLKVNESFRRLAKLNADVYKRLFKTEYHLNNAEQALFWMDRTKSNDLISKTYERVFLENYTDSVIGKLFSEIKDSIVYYSKKIASIQESTNLSGLPLLSSNLNKFNKEYNTLKTQIINKYPEYKRLLISSDSVRKIDVNNILSDQEVLVYFFADKDSLWFAIAGKNIIRIINTPCNNNLNSDINNYNNLILASTLDENMFQVNAERSPEYFTRQQLRKLLGSINYSKYLLSNPIAIGKEQIQHLRDSLCLYFYQLLITPIEKDLIGYKNIVIIPDNILSFMPYASLCKKETNGKHFLAEDHNLRFAQSARLYGITQKRTYDYNLLKRNDLFALAISNYSKPEKNIDSIPTQNYAANNLQTLNRGQLECIIKRSDSFDGDFSDLPFTTREVDNISYLFNKRRNTIIKNDKAIEKNIWMLNNNHELEKYKMLHFATHAVYNNKKIDNTCMVLFDHDSIGPGKESENDGYLSIPEIMRLKLKADLVVLSACETAQGEALPGEGVYGMPYAFLLAGANNVISSLWSVNDKTTEAFFIEFYSRVQHGENYNEALNNIYRLFILKQKGKLNILKAFSKEMEDILNKPEYLNPSFWAAYVLW